MVKNIHVIVDDDVHERLDRIKKEHGLTWKGLLLEGEKRVREDTPSQP